MNSWDLIEILGQKYKHNVISHFDPAFLGENPPFTTIPEAGYQYYLEIVNKGLPTKMLVIGNCHGTLTAWETLRHLRKAGVNTLFCGLNPTGWIYPESRTDKWADRYSAPLNQIIKAYIKASENYQPSALAEISPFFIIGNERKVPNEWIGLCPNAKTTSIDSLPHGLTQYRFGGSAYLTASLVDEFIKNS